MPPVTFTLRRRGFLAGLSALLLTPRLEAESRNRFEPGDPDAWIDRLVGSHRVMIQTHQHFMSALVDARNMLANGRDFYGIPENQHRIAVIAHGSAIQGLFRDETWERFALGEFFKLNDPRTGAPALRNIYLEAQDGEPKDAAVRELQPRGVVFVGCNVALKGLSRKLAKGGDVEAIYVGLMAGLAPGVVIVPDVFVTSARAQDRGVRYIYTDRPR